jgi:D-alanyl-D-alanine carboxypeptidase
MLQDEGKLSIDDKISKWLPGLTRANDVTIRASAFAHLRLPGLLAGRLRDDHHDAARPPRSTSWTPGRKKPLDFEPGTQWQYSNTNYVIAGRIVEIVTKQDLFAFLQKRVLRRWPWRA